MSTIITHDGTCIIVDAEVGVVSAPTHEAAEAEIRRRKAYRNRRSDGGLNIIHRHTEIQTGRA